jgi:hypothetical protein
MAQSFVLPDGVMADIEERAEFGYPECNRAFRLCMTLKRASVPEKLCWELLDKCHSASAAIEKRKQTPSK